MKLLWLSLVLVAASANAKEVEVQMKSISFSPKSIDLVVGDTVVWKNISYTDHSATGDQFDTDLVKPKAVSKPVAFTTPGTYPYHCKIHGKSMSAVVKVSTK
jgi:plastocyanin